MPQSPDFRYDVFLSHNTGDKPRVRRLAERLKEAGLRVWFDEWAGDDIYLAIERGLEVARVHVLCLSPAALGSDWVALERSTVLFRNPSNSRRRFIPLVLADCELPDALRRYKYVDFREEAEAAFDELLTACRVAAEEVPEVSPPKSAETARPALIERLLGSKGAEQPPASQPKPKEEKPQPAKPPEQAEPLVMLERKLGGNTGWVNSVAVSPDGKWAASGPGKTSYSNPDPLPGEKFGESDVHTAVTLLANHGLAGPLKFGDLVLLRPELLNGYAGAIIRAARAHTDEIGCVPEADIYRPNFDFTGVERLKRPDEDLVLRALVQTFLDHSLCIAEDTPYGRHLVFPSQYRRERDIPRDPVIFVSYTFSGEWQTVWTTLVVRLWYSQEFEHRELWRNAAEFASTRGNTLGLLIKKTGDGDATINLYFDVEVPDELKVIFIEYVHRHLARYACDVARDRRYVCSECAKPVTDLDAVRKRLEATKDFIYCQGCDAKVPLIDFIEQRLKSDPVARKILAMDETATREQDAQALEQILIWRRYGRYGTTFFPPMRAKARNG